jgi:hypothetical protein
MAISYCWCKRREQYVAGWTSSSSATWHLSNTRFAAEEMGDGGQIPRSGSIQ